MYKYNGREHIHGDTNKSWMSVNQLWPQSKFCTTWDCTARYLHIKSLYSPNTNQPCRAVFELVFNVSSDGTDNETDYVPFSKILFSLELVGPSDEKQTITFLTTPNSAKRKVINVID